MQVVEMLIHLKMKVSLYIQICFLMFFFGGGANINEFWILG